jgi:hypothetical protein
MNRFMSCLYFGESMLRIKSAGVISSDCLKLLSYCESTEPVSNLYCELSQHSMNIFQHL